MSKQQQPLRVTFLGIDCAVRFWRYPDGSVALMLDAAGSKEGVAVATVCLPGDRPAEGQVFVKDYSENQGVLRALQGAGILRDTGQRVQTGFASVAVCTLLVEPPGPQLAAPERDNQDRLSLAQLKKHAAAQPRQSQDKDRGTER